MQHCISTIDNIYKKAIYKYNYICLANMNVSILMLSWCYKSENNSANPLTAEIVPT